MFSTKKSLRKLCNILLLTALLVGLVPLPQASGLAGVGVAQASGPVAESLSTELEAGFLNGQEANNSAMCMAPDISDPAALFPGHGTTPVAAEAESPAMQSVAAGETPDGLSSAEWASIQTQMEMGKYKAYADERWGAMPRPTWPTASTSPMGPTAPPP